MLFAGPLRRVAASGVHVVRQRLALAAIDVEEELLVAGCALAAMLAVAVLAGLALAAAGLAVIAYWWDTARITATLGVAGVYALAAGGVAMRLAAGLRAKPPFLQATLQELERDGEALSRGVRP